MKHLKLPKVMKKNFYYQKNHLEKYVCLTVYSEYFQEYKLLLCFYLCQVTKNCAVGKVSSGLVTVQTRISIYCIKISFTRSSLFRSEFMLRFPIKIPISETLIINFLTSDNRFGEVSLMGLFGLLNLILRFP